MTLIKSISGIRGTIGGRPGENLTPIDIVKFTTAYCRWLQEAEPGRRLKVVIGRDARISGQMVDGIVEGTVLGCGVDVVNLGLATTPGVEMAVTAKGAHGGIIITASHNPKQWNALKLLNGRGEFLSDADGKRILELAEAPRGEYPGVEQIGKVVDRAPFDDEHIGAVLALPLVDVELVRSKKFKVVVDAVNSVGGIAVPKLLDAMGVECIGIHTTPDGNFPHNPEPLPENLRELSDTVVSTGADLGIAVDPDVDRLALVCEDGTMFGEEYTLVAVADYVLSKTPGNTVSNLSSTRALRDITRNRGGEYSAAAVGEVNVVAAMKESGAVIGGEGNGGIIYPALHYGRDALVGVALFLTHLARSEMTTSGLRVTYPDYHISKNKIELSPKVDVDAVLERIKREYSGERITEIDGVKIDFEDSWVHLRKSNTEPIVRIYSEAKDRHTAAALAQSVLSKIKTIAGL
ncbi:MAG: phosphoglucosamine mutase [Rikenellaceae bacterium]|nr:phosphoglucosamine mutase [Rikenellaceae bacterium]